MARPSRRRPLGLGIVVAISFMVVSHGARRRSAGVARRVAGFVAQALLAALLF